MKKNFPDSERTILLISADTVDIKQLLSRSPLVSESEYLDRPDVDVSLLRIAGDCKISGIRNFDVN